ncbi:MAG: adaptor protein MecA [Clostridiales bacterium]|nr:adaptor protein MecA [Clostridiales bacterium]
MKIEKVNDNQIRCTLTKSDLADRELKISELAYGTEKAKNLFRDMMQQASYEFGFEAEDIPLMIEAIPLNSECIVLIITKVEDPEELDTRFSKFAPSVHDEEPNTEENLLAKGADDVLDLFRRIQEGRIGNSKQDREEEPDSNDKTAADSKASAVKAVRPAAPDVDVTRIFSFDSLNGVTRLSHVLNNFYQGINSLYKNASTGRYMLVIAKTDHTPEEFNKVCNILSEYASPERFAAAGEAYLEEHYEPVIKDNAVQALSKL